jgi:hypothetical protein
MLRRKALWLWGAGTGGLIALALAAGCRGGHVPAVGGEPLVRRPAQQLALTLSDLPAGFGLGEELVSSAGTTAAAGDPWGKVSAYAVTYVALPVPPPGPGRRSPPSGLGDVVSSVNAYAGADYARSAFAAWQAAVPQTYRPVLPERDGATAGYSVYVQDDGSACLIGCQTHNVIASIWVSAASKSAAPPVAAAASFARLVAHRIETVAGR